MLAPLSVTIRLISNSCLHLYISFINNIADKISISKVHICYLKCKYIMSNFQCMFVSKGNIREMIVLWSTIPFLETQYKALTCQCFLFKYLFKKEFGSATVSTPFKWHHKRSNIYLVRGHAGTADWIEEVCIMINYRFNR